MEEDENGDDLCGAERLCEVDGAVAGGVEGSWEVDSGEEVGGGDEVVEGEDAVEGERVGGNFAVEKLGEVTVEGAVGTAEEGVSELEVGNEDPCVEWDYSLQNKKKNFNVRWDVYRYVRTINL